ncbi:MAG: glycosyltransferase family 39 protein [Pseudomonadota bacterium]
MRQVRTLSKESVSRSRLFGLLVFAIVGARVLGLFSNQLDLGTDEAQYWHWSRSFDFGYFSKPPLIAWIIGASTALFGNAEWAVRLAFPLLHGGTAWALYLLGRALYSDRVGFWAGLGYLALPAASLSSGVASTDAPLLLCWTSALALFAASLERRTLAKSLALGLLIGAGFLAKYAMIYFALGAGLTALMRRDARSFLLSGHGALVGAGALAAMSPNLLWNARNGFSTVSHTAANANWGASLFNPDAFLKFFGDQFVVFGPLYFAALLAGAALIVMRGGRGRGAATSKADRLLIAFSAPILLIILAQAFISRAHANWAAAAIPAVTLMTTAWLLNRQWTLLLKGVIAAHLALGAGLLGLAAQPNWADEAGLANAFKRVRGWETTAEVVAETARRQGGLPVIAQNRDVAAALLYYGRGDETLAGRIRVHAPHPAPRNHFEAALPIMRAEEPSLFVTKSAAPPPETLGESEFLGAACIRTGQGKVRTVFFFVVGAPSAD